MSKVFVRRHHVLLWPVWYIAHCSRAAETFYTCPFSISKRIWSNLQTCHSLFFHIAEKHKKGIAIMKILGRVRRRTVFHSLSLSLTYTHTHTRLLSQLRRLSSWHVFILHLTDEIHWQKCSSWWIWNTHVRMFGINSKYLLCIKPQVKLSCCYRPIIFCYMPKYHCLYITLSAFGPLHIIV